MNQVSKQTVFKIMIVILSVLFLASVTTAVVFGVKYYNSNKNYNSVSEQNNSNKAKLDEQISAYEDLKEQNSSEVQSYEDKLSAQQSEHESAVDKLNKEIKDLNKQLAAKKTTNATKKTTTTKSDTVKNDTPVTMPKPTPSKGKTVYLTFDDGPSQYTPQILDVLDKYGVKATFFVKNGGSYNYVMKDIVNRGHAIGLHTYSHDYSKIYASDEAYFKDLNKISNLVNTQTGIETKIMRFPGGSSNTVSRKYSKGIMTRLSKEVTNQGYAYFDWNCSNGDADGANTVQKQLNYCSQYPKSASTVIVLMHDTKKTTMQALPKIIEYYQSCGMNFGVITTSTPAIHHGINN